MQRTSLVRTVALVGVALTAWTLAETGRAEACHDARQERIFPLGTVDGELLALRVAVYRGGAESARWTISPSLVQIAQGARRSVLSEYKARTFDDLRDYDKAMTRALARSFRAASRRKGFRAIRMQDRVLCENRRSCGLASLSEKAGDLLVSVSGRTSAVVPVAELDSLYNEPRNYEIAETRVYRSAQGSWTIVDIRAGDARCGSIVNQAAALECAKPKARSETPLAIGRSYTWRSSYHHGIDKSVVIWQAAK